jgi:hypothetical protein
MRTHDDRGWVLLSALCATLMAQSCGDDDEGGSYSSGLPSDKVLAELTAEEAMQACEGFAEELGTIISADQSARAACTGEAVGDNVSMSEDGELSLDVAGCNDDVEQCMATAGDQFAQEDIQCDSEEITLDLADCQVTVGEFERCINSVTSSLRSWLDATTCSALGRPGALEEFAEMQEAGGIDPFGVPACTSLADECPGLDLFEGSGNASGGPGAGEGPGGCSNTCASSGDRECDDGGPSSLFSICPLGTDCDDCGPRP